VGVADESASGPLCFISEELARYPNEAMFRYDLPRHGDTWALRVFPQLLCMESLLQCAERFLGRLRGGLKVDRLRFTGSVRPGDSLLLKLQQVGSTDVIRRLSVEVWVHHRMVAQGQLSEAIEQN